MDLSASAVRAILNEVRARAPSPEDWATALRQPLQTGLSPWQLWPLMAFEAGDGLARSRAGGDRRRPGDIRGSVRRPQCPRRSDRGQLALDRRDDRGPRR